jgi:hypothetical protein
MARPDFSVPVGLGSLQKRSNHNLLYLNKPRFRSDGPAYQAWTEATLKAYEAGGGTDYRVYMKIGDARQWR